jgi:hypothetical protein
VHLTEKVQEIEDLMAKNEEIRALYNTMLKEYPENKSQLSKHVNSGLTVFWR